MSGPLSNFSYKSAAWLTLRRAALRMAGYRCAFCRADVSGFKASRVDHILPARERPDLAYSLANLRVLCARCDNARHAEKGGRKIARVNIGLDGFPETGV